MGILGVPLFVDMEFSKYREFWIMVWGSFWGFGAGALYQYLYHGADITNKVEDLRVWKILNKKK